MTVTMEELRRIIRDEYAREKVNGQPPESHIDHVCGCPDCYCGVLKKARETMRYQCRDCKVPLPDQIVGHGENPTPCPNCGGMDAEEIKR